MVYADLIKEMYYDKEEFIILGLTGRTGSGCTTVANILAENKFEGLNLEIPQSKDFNDVEKRKYKILYNFMSQDDHWHPFVTIEMSSIILYFALARGNEAIIKWIDDMCNNKEIQIPDKDGIYQELKNNLTDIFNRVSEFTFDELRRLSALDISDTSIISDEDKKTFKKYYHYFTSEIKDIKEQFGNTFQSYNCYKIINSKERGKERTRHNFYTYFLQMLGNNLRESGDPFKSTLYESKYNCFIKKIDDIIKFIIAYNKLNQTKIRICIDAIRNPYEAHYLHDHYRSFLLMAISTDDKDRRARLGSYKKEEMDNLDNVEYPIKFYNPSERFYHQNIQECLEIADIHIYNQNVKNKSFQDLKQQLIKYIALIIHPGLITPTHIERCMQLAFNAKYNSGCLSRQVGAVVTRADYSVQSVGWNDVPKGQISCNLRDIFDFNNNRDASTYSKYELESDEFDCAMKRICIETSKTAKGRPIPYCFKDIYNGIKGDKNQVYTRALHAEENAFLQISKYGGTQVQDGFLFVTASPCELCSKKSFQLGIKKIYYIDPYPGIAQKHIISYHIKDKPEMQLFYGAIGYAYMELYSQRIAYKDELELMTGVKTKDVVRDSHEEVDELMYEDMNSLEIYSSLIFDADLVNVKYEESLKGVVKCKCIERMSKKIRWTGNKVNSIKSEECDIVREKDDGEYHVFTISFENPITQNNTLKYNIEMSLNDDGHIMEKYFAKTIIHQTKNISLELVFPKEKVKNVFFKEYADKTRSVLINKKEIEGKSEGAEIKYVYKRKNPNVNYTYVLEWEESD
jgi:deoxycytidylate deaminase